MNLHKRHKIIKRKIEEDGVGDLKGMGYHSFFGMAKRRQEKDLGLMKVQ